MLRNTRQSLGFLDARFAPLSHAHADLYSPLSHTHSYLPLAGGTLTGSLTLGEAGAGLRSVRLHSTDAGNYLDLVTYAASSGLVTTGGALYITAGASNLNLAATAGYIWLKSAPAKEMYFDAGGVYYWRDADASSAVRMTLDSATGNLTLGTDAAGAKTLTLHSGTTARASSIATSAAGSLAITGGNYLTFISALADVEFRGPSKASFQASNGTEKASINLTNGNTVIGGTLIVGNLPTTNPGVAGQLWNDGGTVKVSAGA